MSGTSFLFVISGYDWEDKIMEGILFVLPFICPLNVPVLRNKNVRYGVQKRGQVLKPASIFSESDNLNFHIAVTKIKSDIFDVFRSLIVHEVFLYPVVTGIP